jgi:hypothetical protein
MTPWAPRRNTSCSMGPTGREAKLTSCVFRITCLTSRDEATMTGSSQKRSIMSGPWRRARSRRAWCGGAPAKWCKWPMTGSARGPGGSLSCCRVCFARDNVKEPSGMASRGSRSKYGRSSKAMSSSSSDVWCRVRIKEHTQSRTLLILSASLDAEQSPKFTKARALFVSLKFSCC